MGFLKDLAYFPSALRPKQANSNYQTFRIDGCDCYICGGKTNYGVYYKPSETPILEHLKEQHNGKLELLTRD